MLSFQSRTATTTRSDLQPSELVESLLPDIQHASESCAPQQIRPFFEAELSKKVRVCISKLQKERRVDVCHERDSIQKPILPKFGSASLRRRRQVGRCESWTTRTILGKLRCFVSSYNVIPPLITDGEEISETFESGTRRETQISFVFKPSKWLIKSGVSRIFHFERTKSFSRSWQTTLRTFNVRIAFS